MKYLVRCTARNGLILGEAVTKQEAEKLINEHINKLWFPSEETKNRFRERQYRYDEIVLERTKVTPYWAVRETHCLVDGKTVIFCGAPTRIRSDYEDEDARLRVLYAHLRND